MVGYVPSTPPPVSLPSALPPDSGERPWTPTTSLWPPVRRSDAFGRYASAGRRAPARTSLWMLSDHPLTEQPEEPPVGEASAKPPSPAEVLMVSFGLQPEARAWNKSQLGWVVEAGA